MTDDRDRAASFIECLNDAQYILLLGRLMYELTLAGRACYEVNSPAVAHPLQLRVVNELQHKVSAQIINASLGGSERFPASAFVALFLDLDGRDDIFSGEVRRSFGDALSATMRTVHTKSPANNK